MANNANATQSWPFRLVQHSGPLGAVAKFFQADIRLTTQPIGIDPFLADGFEGVS